MIKTFSTLSFSAFRTALLSLVIAGLVLSYHLNVFAAGKTPENIIVLGDSLSAAYGINIDEGWVALLQQQLTDQGYGNKVINVSVSGDTTRNGLNKIDAALQAHQPGIIIIALGGNDALRGLAFDEIKNSLSQIIERCKKAKAKILLLGVRMPPNYGAAYGEKFAQLYRDLAVKYDIALVPRMLDQIADNPELMQADNTHPKAEAQPILMQNVWSGLKPILDR